MKTKLILILLLFVQFGYGQKKTIYHKGWIDFNKNGKLDVYEDPAAKTEDRIEDLLTQMTMDEKTCQLATLYGSGRVLTDALPTAEWDSRVWKDGIGNIDEQHNGLGTFKSEYSFPFSKHVETIHQTQLWFVENTRLGIPVDFTNEGIRGLCHDRATYFPAQCGQGATWDKDLIARIGEVEAQEAKVLGYTNIYSPILDLAQDPRWGRVVECYGEDPYLVSQLGKQMIKSLQDNGLVSTVKHFAVYSVPVGGRDGKTRTDPHVAPREMKTLYLEPFRVAFEDAGAMGVMSSYNDYDGVPITGSLYFLTELLRQQWGFKGYVVSDSGALEFLYSKHHVSESEEDAVADAINAGLNIRTNFTKPEEYVAPLRDAVAHGKISPKTIDSRVADVLRVKFYLGLFDNPYLGDSKLADEIVHSKEHQAVALEAARKSIVLLKNEDNFLPLKKSLKSVAVIGPNADERELLLSRYGPANAPIKTVFQGISEMLPDANVSYAKGCDIIDEHFPESEIMKFPKSSDEATMLSEAVDLANQSEAVVLVLGGSELTVREDRSRTSLDLPGHQQELMEAIYATGKPVVLVLLDGRASSINFAAKNLPAIVHAWFPGEFTGQAVSEVLFGDYNPGGKLAVTFPKSVGQIPFAFPFKPGSNEDSETAVWGALYPFGFGLSYTTFEYSDLSVTPKTQGLKGTVTVRFKVRNSGDRTGDEVVQLYLNDAFSSVTTYTKVLRGFERFSLEPGEQKEVEFTLGEQELGLWDIHEQFTVEAGIFNVMVGSSSEDIRLSGSFEITNN
ncbi:glycoside hydrolase family 3 N-terminal domain-containing protein [Mangrovibacterium diazotrophicum]|uniref:Beta-glucosidase n=1 Tax=Mangrovibacterium diazotrophicum TaxID=1261403 RepID=A0A419W4I2_9BACT|nr:glycoside hydrolase family 3 N-terminal domain-containing protein [Mangrovibacterium diazotrophicum]RKD90340.1 beta-glucosidase [Mangrovibacterium diazotrophicum]